MYLVMLCLNGATKTNVFVSFHLHIPGVQPF